MSPKTQPYYVGKIESVDIYKNDIVVKRSGKPKAYVAPGERAKIMEFSAAARKRLAFVASNTEVDFVGMITLTYPREFCTNGKAVKGHLYRFIHKFLVKALPGVRYLWFLEFQKRGAPHVHILTDKFPSPGRQTRALQWEVAEEWNGIVAPGDADHLRAGTRTERLRTPEGGKHYVIKYALKTHQKKVPPGYESVGRFYGYNKGVKPNPILTVPITARELHEQLTDWKYLPDNPEDLYKVLYNSSGVYAPKVVQYDMFLNG